MNEEKLKDAEIKRLETELDMVQTAWQELKGINDEMLFELRSQQTRCCLREDVPDCEKCGYRDRCNLLKVINKAAVGGVRTKDYNIAELERENHELKEETVRIYQQMLSLYRAVKRANVELDAIEEKCDNNVWFQKTKERTY